MTTISSAREERGCRVLAPQAAYDAIRALTG